MTSPLDLLNSGCALAEILVDESFKQILPDGTRLKKGTPHPSWNGIAPNRFLADQKLLTIEFQDTVMPVGSIVPKDREIPLVDCPKAPVTLDSPDKFKVALGKHYTEEKLCEIAGMMQYLNCFAEGDPTRREIADRMEDSVAMDPAVLIQALVNLSIVIMAQIQSRGYAYYNDHRTNLDVGQFGGFDYRDSVKEKAPTSGFLPKLTGTNKWSDVAAKPVTDIVEHLRAKYDETGRFPNGIKWSSRIQRLVLNSQQMKTYIAEIRGAHDPGSATLPANCDDLLNLMGLLLADCNGFPADFEFVVDDSCYYYEDQDSNMAERPFHPVDSYSFFTDGVMTRVWWRSAAYIYSVMNGGGLLKFNQVFNQVFAALGVIQNVDPPQERLTVSSCFAPIVRDCEMMGGRKVI